MATIVTRAGKGSPLTHNEVDANFETLNSDKVETSSVSAFGATLIDDADAATARTTLGLGTAATTASTDYATAAQGALADSAVQPNDSPTFGSITVTGTVDGRDVAADGTKLDGIEAGADVTDTANVTAAGALMDSELSNITAVKALDQGVATTDSPSFAGLTVDTNTLYVDSTNNRVGVGTSSPANDLDVVGTVSATGGYVETGSDDTFTQAVFTSYRAGEGAQTGNFVRLRSVGDGAGNANQLIFDVNSAEAIRIGSAGQLGIGGANYGTSGQVLTSNGTGSAPSWQNRTIRVWAYYDGVGNSIKNSEGLSSVTDTAVGQPRFNFSSSVGTAAFGVTVHVMQSSEGNTQSGGYMDGAYVNDRTTTTLLMNTVNDSSSTTSSADMRQLDIQVAT